MKQFVFDRLVDRENICNLESEQKELRNAVRRKTAVVVYGPRNYGKTSVIRNVIIEEFKSAHKRNFVFFADLLGIRSMQSLAERMSTSLQRCFADSFPVKSLLESARRFLGSLRPEVSLDAQTGNPTISLHTDGVAPAHALNVLWEHIAKIAQEVTSLIVLDEFQDVALVDEAPAKMRAGLEAIGDVPVVILGSKRHMLSDLFARPNAPLNGWGTDLQFKPIPYNEYHAYIEERFGQRRLQISFDQAKGLQDDMQRVPEAVNRLCAQILELYEKTEIDQSKIRSALMKLLENREGRYAAYLASFSGTDENVLCKIAQKGTVKHPQAKTFLNDVGLSNRSVGIAVKRLWDLGVLERTIDGYRITDPLLSAYLRFYR